MKTKPFALRLLGVLLAALSLSPSLAFANGFPTLYWLGTNGTSWTAGDNWSQNSTSGDPATDFQTNAYINFSAISTNTTATILGGNQTISSLTINTTAPVGISGGNLTVTGNIYAGQSSSGNTLQLGNGVAVSGTYMAAGYDLGANNNQVIVGANATLTLTDKFDVGFNGSSNNLTITDGGKVILNNGGSSIGSFAARNNSVLIDGAGSTLTSIANYYVGFEGEGNLLTISNQGVMDSEFLVVGGATGASGSGSNNTVFVTSNASLLLDTLTIANVGSNNTLTVPLPAAYPSPLCRVPREPSTSAPLAAIRQEARSTPLPSASATAPA